MRSAAQSGIGRRVRVLGVLAIGAGIGLAWIAAGGDPFVGFDSAWFAAVGLVLVWRRPGEVIGWLLLVIAAAFVSFSALPGSAADIIDGRLSAPLTILAWVNGWGSVVFFGAFVALAAVFPSGQLPAGRLGLTSRLAIVASAIFAVASAFTPELDPRFADGSTGVVRNPIAIAPDWPGWPIVVIAVYVVVIAALFIAITSFGIRFRRARGLEREQDKWLIAALAALLATVIFAIAVILVANPAGAAMWLPAAVAYPTVPVAIGIAVTRYRLYDIDLLINRTVAYGTVMVVLAGAFAVVNLAVQRVLEGVMHEHSDIVTGALIVGGALAFGPVSRRARPIADRLLPGRAVLTLLFTDIVGSTQAIVELGDEQWRQLLGRFRVAVRQELGRFSGHEVNMAGDAFFATFELPTDGIRCAWAIRSAVRALGLETRTGLHRGECEMRGEQVSGLAVHTAARIMAAGGAGEILVSDALQDAVRKVGGRLQARGAKQLKGVPGTWPLFAVEDG